VRRLGPNLDLYLCFVRADTAVAGKDQRPLSWFEDFVLARAR
jgi:hypothetical protein